MPDYKEMYFKLFRATEDAISRLIAAQRECEDMFINSPEQEPCIYLYPREESEEAKKKPD